MSRPLDPKHNESQLGAAQTKDWRTRLAALQRDLDGADLDIHDDVAQARALVISIDITHQVLAKARTDRSDLEARRDQINQTINFLGRKSQDLEATLITALPGQQRILGEIQAGLLRLAEPLFGSIPAVSFERLYGADSSRLIEDVQRMVFIAGQLKEFAQRVEGAFKDQMMRNEGASSFGSLLGTSGEQMAGQLCLYQRSIDEALAVLKDLEGVANKYHNVEQCLPKPGFNNESQHVTSKRVIAS